MNDPSQENDIFLIHVVTHLILAILNSYKRNKTISVTRSLDLSAESTRKILSLCFDVLQKEGIILAARTEKGQIEVTINPKWLKEYYPELGLLWEGRN